MCARMLLSHICESKHLPPLFIHVLLNFWSHLAIWMKLYTFEFRVSKRTSFELKIKLKLLLLILEVISAVENHPVCVIIFYACFEWINSLQCTWWNPLRLRGKGSSSVIIVGRSVKGLNQRCCVTKKHSFARIPYDKPMLTFPRRERSGL